MNEQQKANVIAAVQASSERWKNAFNSGNAAECAAQYEPSAVMKAEPFGTFEGIEAIQGFWQKLMDDEFSNVEYLDPKIEVVGHESAILTSSWRMNKAQGVIHRELWKIQDDGSAKLQEDHFEATG